MAPKRGEVSTVRPVVFLGPSLPRERAESILDAEYRPPIARGDLERLPPSTKVVGIIDGVFHQKLAVSPSEIRAAIRRGVVIYGSSSMGALRACEVPEMRGVGRVFRMFADGEIEDDDEVALTFDPVTFRPYSEPLVNVRYAVGRLTGSGTLDPKVGRALVAAGRRLFYPDRTYPRILEAARLKDREDAPQLLGMLRMHDIKAEDAVTLLEHLAMLDPATLSSSTATTRARRTREATAPVAAPTESELSAEAPIFLWEYGEQLPFDELVRFMKLTGTFMNHARNAVARFVLEGNALKTKAAPPAKVTHRIAEALVWKTFEAWLCHTRDERFTLLRNVGLPADELVERIHEEAAATSAVLGIARESSDAFLRALRSELFMNELALKRYAVRYGSLRYFSARYPERRGAPTESERRDVRECLCELHDAATWGHVIDRLALLRVKRDEADAFVELVARARFAARDVGTERTPVAGRSRGKRRGQALRVPNAPKLPGDPRFCVAPAESLRHAKRLGGVVNVTRISLITGLDSIGLPICQAFRPDGIWSSTVGSGKSTSVVGAKIGAVMEEVEKWAQERFPGPATRAAAIHGSYAELARRHVVVDPSELSLPFDSKFSESTPLSWIELPDLVTGAPVLVPLAALTNERLPNDPFHSEWGGAKPFDTNGLASAFTLAEALSHGISEIIERHSVTVASVAVENPGVSWPHGYRLIDQGTVPPSTRRIIDRVTRGGYRLSILDVTCAIGVPTFHVHLSAPRESPHSQFADDLFIVEGSGAHPSAEVAINTAILEAVQSRVGMIAGAREDFALRARSLGRHERTRCHSRAGLLFRHGAMGMTKSFEEVRGFHSTDARDDVMWMVERLQRVGIAHLLVADLSLPEIAPARVVRVLAPGIETLNPLRTGPWARKVLIGDLLGVVPVAR